MFGSYDMVMSGVNLSTANDVTAPMGSVRVRKVGFYGCARKVVRVEPKVMPERTYPRRVRMTCPACKHEHDVVPFWRKYDERLDAGKVSELIP